MSIVKKLFRKVLHIFRPYQEVRREALPPPTFHKILPSETPPRNDSVEAGLIYLVAPKNEPLWALLRCPCGCSAVITLSLQKAHRPHWTLTATEAHRPTLYPSVWRNVGCLSHFWIRDGRVFW